jgi:hypothetical protein
MGDMLTIAIVILALLLFGFNFLPGKKQKAKRAASGAGRVDLQALRLQACERLILLMERINPTELVLRYNPRAGTVADLQLFLLNAVREETAHNYAQQLYVSGATWALVMAARNTIMNLINQSAGALQPGDPSATLAKKIIDNAATLDLQPTREAIKAIKAEVRRNI